ncbi:SAM-dependent methyltransferase [Streptomyces sp. WMMC500]|uniref:SAM-dependent methyltransferase n=1 Tax=Streptomyces sp. WMMC500 TaxID=3015154 RepID=UPI00248B157F|nr:SAM-dependent methyltransferase [Streptomyces sp. WMMC500]WBB63911.1 SAM-dependent methyltransferase [Streptomyces sp. WMMC500]
MPDELADGNARVDRSVAHSARMWDYWLGGKNHYAADREAGDAVRRVFPGIVVDARQQRAFLRRAVRFLTREAGVRQFLDLGSGLPANDNTHEVAQRVDPACRIVYVDNDPIVLAHAQALLTSSPEGACAYVDADVRDIGGVLDRAAQTLDFARPVGVVMLGIFGNIPDLDRVGEIRAAVLEAVCPGSYLVISDGDTTDPARLHAVEEFNRSNPGHEYTNRSVEQITAYFDGLELVEPGVVSTPLWRPGPATAGAPEKAAIHCGVARKP